MPRIAIGAAVTSEGWRTDAPLVTLLLHGFGADERDLAPIGDGLGGLPWASPRGPLALPHGGAAWFPITTPGNPDAATVAEATDALWAWIDATLTPATRIVPVGFSQGGLMASQLLRTRPERVAATVVLGGFVQAAGQPGDDRLAATLPPAFWGRGDADGVIAGAAVRRTADWLPAHTTPTVRVYAGLGHGISAAELDDVRSFLAAALAPRDER